MSKKENQHQIYIRSTRQWIPVSEEFYKSYYRDVDTFRRRQQRHGRCTCSHNNWRLCDKDCETCKFRRAGDELSLEAEMHTDSADGETSLAETLMDPEMDIEAAFILTDLIDALHRKIESYDSEGQRICQLIMEGKSQHEIAEDLGLSWSSFRRRWEKIRHGLFAELKDFYF